MTEPFYDGIDVSSLPGTEGYFPAAAGQAQPFTLQQLSRLNILIGPNNSGKSRFLRAIATTTTLKYHSNSPHIAAIERAVGNADRDVRKWLSGEDTGIISYGNLMHGEVFKPYTGSCWLSELENRIDALNGLTTALSKISTFERITHSQKTNYRGGPNEAHYIQRKLDAPLKAILEAIAATPQPPLRKNRIYIPILRGLRPLTKNDDYETRTKRDYAIKDTADVFTGLKMYDTLRDMLLGARSEREAVREYENFLSTELFDGTPIELTPHRSGDVVYVRIGENHERPVFELGDGIQSLIALTFPGFVATDSSIVCMEEPETHLHPGMQRKLLELFHKNSRLSRHQYFATTHSNHLIDMAADYTSCTTLLFRRQQQDGEFKIRSVGQADRMTLEDLGVRTSSVFLTSATIWVEGITDRLYLREYLAKFISETNSSVREDTHYSFLEGGGSCIAHFDFSTDVDTGEFTTKLKTARVCSQSFVILDGDNRGKRRVAELSAALGDKLYILKGKEVENLLPLPVVVSYVESQATANTGLLNQEDYQSKNIGLGEVLDNKLGLTIFRDGQTIKNKSAFCTFTVEFMRNNPDKWELTEEARELCERLVRFIRAANGLPAR